MDHGTEDPQKDGLKVLSFPVLHMRRSIGVPGAFGQKFRKMVLESQFSARKSFVYFNQNIYGDYDETKILSAFPKMGILVGSIRNTLRLYRLCFDDFEDSKRWRPELMSAFELDQARIEEVSSSYFIYNNFLCFSVIENTMTTGSINVCTYPLDPLANLPDGWIERIHMKPARAIWACECSPVAPVVVAGGEKMMAFYYMGESRFIKRTLKHSVRCVCFSRNGQVVYGGSRNDQVWMLDPRSPQLVDLFKLRRGIGCIKVLDDSYSMISSTFDNGLFRCDLRMNRTVFEFAGHNNEYLKIPFSFDETSGILCSVGQDRYLRFWDLNHGKPIFYLIPDDDDEAVVSAHLSDSWKCPNSQRETRAIVASSGSALSVIQL